MEKFFSEHGLLAESLTGFEPRAGQLRMAEAVAAVLDSDINEVEEGIDQAKILVVEAETGIGKTLAYLIPAVLSGQRLVVSTATITLQDQILNKEIPLIARILNMDIKALCVKGRQNYLCYYRWFQYRSSAGHLLPEDEDLARIDAWLQETETGDRSELSWLSDWSPLWARISAQSHQCLGAECPEGGLCFVNQLRRKAGSARLLIVNHHLFFSDLALRKSGFGEVLPRYEGVIFDEAHHLENVATNFFGTSFSQYQLLDLLGDVQRQAEADLAAVQVDRLRHVVVGLKERLDRFVALFPAGRGRFPLLPLIDKTPQWQTEVDSLVAGLNRLGRETDDLAATNEGWQVIRRRTEELVANLVHIALPQESISEHPSVSWYEKREKSVGLSSTPIDIAPQLQEYLYPAIESCVMTSATLTTGGDFSYIQDRLGLDEHTRTLRLDSPFDYTGRTLFYIPEANFPEPSGSQFADALCSRVAEILEISRGRALVLFTSLKGMEYMASFLEQRFDFPVLVQGSASRQALLERFRTETDSILLAVASFWEGVDIPGESLSCVIIDKLPFEVPSDPVIQARIEAITKGGGRPFFDFQVPRAILALRQGVGRLMRASSDRGLIAVMDVRLFNKGYGRLFIKSLPPSPVVRSLLPVTQFFMDGQPDEHIH